jgi:hypothetical protein
MSTFKTTKDILKNPWITSNNLSNGSVPRYSFWDHRKELSVENIKLWEEIYYQAGNIGIYASWDPYAEFYIIVHNLFINRPEGIETFYGKGSSKRVEDRAKQLGIILPKNITWIDDENFWVVED